MLLSPRQEVIAEAQAAGVSLLDAELLSYFVNSGELIALEAQQEDYQAAKVAFEASLEALSNSRSEAIYRYETAIIPQVSSKEDARYYLDMLSLAYQDLAALKEKRPIKLTSYATLLTPLASSLPHPNESLLEIMKVRSQLDLNLSVALLLEHLVNYLTKEL